MELNIFEKSDSCGALRYRSKSIFLCFLNCDSAIANMGLMRSLP
ncbi:MAG: hypothetical protein PT120_12050 [Aphanizomenon gracile PMC649.10]|nr:hypothetical protein [Aphanizomenon sp. 202]MDK2458701.1 hypothetical protein [Aphanizomenon sp. PH219]MDM3846904.1 hypothetical protein [Aphanizomenon gracile PMC638.10]MDM3850663.1 hypothetical protein [Aphanizomenon gracile PMC627.10]MDM3855600.1 hypothetical protein [Aphanizomenon gracile PMC649.10]